jgi:hypothetical protein
MGNNNQPSLKQINNKNNILNSLKSSSLKKLKYISNNNNITNKQSNYNHSNLNRTVKDTKANRTNNNKHLKSRNSLNSRRSSSSSNSGKSSRSSSRSRTSQSDDTLEDHINSKSFEFDHNFFYAAQKNSRENRKILDNQNTANLDNNNNTISKPTTLFYKRANLEDFSYKNYNNQMSLRPKTNPIYEDYIISKQVLGMGISGKVLSCVNKKTNQKYALKV